MGIEQLLDDSVPSFSLTAAAEREMHEVVAVAYRDRRMTARRRHAIQAVVALGSLFAVGGATAAAIASPSSLPWADPLHAPGAQHISVGLTKSFTVDGVAHFCTVRIQIDVDEGDDTSAATLAALDYLGSSAPQALPPDPNFLMPPVQADGTFRPLDARSYAQAWQMSVMTGLGEHIRSVGLPANGIGMSGWPATCR